MVFIKFLRYMKTTLKIALFLIFFCVNSINTYSQTMFDVVEYKGIISDRDVVLKMYYGGYYFKGEYYFVDDETTIIDLASEKNYEDEDEIVVLTEYKDLGFSSYEEIKGAIEKSNSAIMFYYSPLENYSTSEFLIGVKLSLGKNNECVILSKVQ